MFGFSFSELVVVILVAVVVMGPKDLPKMLRRVGQWAGKIRRAAADLRAQSGIDEALRTEGLADDIAEIRKLARGELDAVRVAATINDHDRDDRPVTRDDSYGRADDFYVVRDREYPREGADAYGALPDNAIVYADGLPKSPHDREALYVMGDENAVLPQPEPQPQPTAVAGAGPTLMGGAAVDMDGFPLRAPDVHDVHEALTAKPGEVSATLMGIGNPLAERADTSDDDAEKKSDDARGDSNRADETETTSERSEAR